MKQLTFYGKLADLQHEPYLVRQLSSPLFCNAAEHYSANIQDILMTVVQLQSQIYGMGRPQNVYTENLAIDTLGTRCTVCDSPGALSYHDVGNIIVSDADASKG